MDPEGATGGPTVPPMWPLGGPSDRQACPRERPAPGSRPHRPARAQGGLPCGRSPRANMGGAAGSGLRSSPPSLAPGSQATSAPGTPAERQGRAEGRGQTMHSEQAGDGPPGPGAGADGPREWRLGCCEQGWRPSVQPTVGLTVGGAAVTGVRTEHQEERNRDAETHGGPEEKAGVRGEARNGHILPGGHTH